MEVKWMFIIGVIVAFILGFFLGWMISKKSSKRKDYDGTLLIGEEEDREQFRFIFSTELEELREKHELVMEIRKESA